MEYDVPTIPAATVQITIGSNLRPYIKDPACCLHIFFTGFIRSVLFPTFYNFMSRETGNVSCIFMQICRFIGQKRRKETYEQHTCIKNTVSGRTGPDGYDHLRHGIYPTGILSDTGIIHYLSDRTGSSWRYDPWTGGWRNLRTGFRNHQLYAVLRYGRFRNDVIQHQSTGNRICLHRSKNPGGMADRTVFKAIRQKMKNGAYLVASLACPFLNTLFFMSALVLIFYHTDYIQGFVTSLGVSNPFTFVLAFCRCTGTD